VRWLGTASFAIEHDGHTVLIDPYVTRASMLACLSGPLTSDIEAIHRYSPEADAILTGHTHFDHVLDVPGIAKLTGARVFGSRSCAALCQIEGLPEEQVVDVESMRRSEPYRVTVGPFDIRFVPSEHSSFLLGRVPFPGDIADCDQVPLHTKAYRCGAVFSLDIRVAGRRIYHLGSAQLLDDVPSRDIDLLLMCVAGWTTTERFPQRVMSSLRPGTILLSHWDNFFSPIEKGAKMLPAMQMPRLVDELCGLEPNLRIGTVSMLGELSL